MTPKGSKIVFEKNKGTEIKIVKFYTWLFWINIYWFIWIINLFLFISLWTTMFFVIKEFSDDNLDTNYLIYTLIPSVLFGIASLAWLTGGPFFIRFARLYKRRKVMEVLLNYKDGYTIVNDKKSIIILTQFLGVPHLHKKIKK